MLQRGRTEALDQLSSHYEWDMTLKIDQATLDRMEQQHPGIAESIRLYEAMKLPSCSHCGSKDTASVGGGIVGRSIYLAAATTRFKLAPDGLEAGKYYCNGCEGFFGG